MMRKLAPYGSLEQADNVAKVGKSKTSIGLVDRMPSPDIVAKVGKGITPSNLADRMPSAAIAAKVGLEGINAKHTHRIVRRNQRR